MRLKKVAENLRFGDFQQLPFCAGLLGAYFATGPCSLQTSASTGRARLIGRSPFQERRARSHLLRERRREIYHRSGVKLGALTVHQP